nr:WAS/WASL-interacting protein family member 3-like [Penaeus vannamei]
MSRLCLSTRINISQARVTSHANTYVLHGQALQPSPASPRMQITLAMEHKRRTDRGGSSLLAKWATRSQPLSAAMRNLPHTRAFYPREGRGGPLGASVGMRRWMCGCVWCVRSDVKGSANRPPVISVSPAAPHRTRQGPPTHAPGTERPSVARAGYGAQRQVLEGSQSPTRPMDAKTPPRRGGTGPQDSNVESFTQTPSPPARLRPPSLLASVPRSLGPDARQQLNRLPGPSPLPLLPDNPLGPRLDDDRLENDCLQRLPRPLEELPLPPRRCITTPPTVDTVVGRGRAGGRRERSTLLPSLRPGRAAHTMAARRPPYVTRTRPARLPACQAYSSPTLPLATSPSPSPLATPTPTPSPHKVLQKLGASHATLPITSRGKRVPLAVPIFFRTAPDRLPTADPSARAQAPGARRIQRASGRTLPRDGVPRPPPPSSAADESQARWPFTRSTTVSLDSRRAPAPAPTPPPALGTIHYDSDKNKSEKIHAQPRTASDAKVPEFTCT